MRIFVTSQPIHPGEYIDDELKARSMTHDDLAAITGISRRQLINIIKGKAGITPETALAIADAFGEGHDALGWMNLQSAYELALAAQKGRDVKKRAAIYAKVPVREMVRRGWISDAKKTSDLERIVCQFLDIETIDQEPNVPVAARKSTSYDVDTAAQKAWYRRCRLLAESAPAAIYSESKLEGGIQELLKLAAYPEDARRIPNMLADMGIRFVINKQLKGTKIDAVAFWLDAQSPAIAVSLRHGRIDNLWYNLMHELVHIKYRHQNTVIDVDMESATDELPEMERIANEEAANYLVPKDAIESFIARAGGYFYQTRVVQFAQAQQVHPGIVIGQLHHHPNGLKQNQLRKLLVPIRAYIIGQAVTDGWGSSPDVEDD
jgi:HTH-type transcriptional regulator/antitoxin HigA